jgi:hypothetical protein
MTKINGLFEFLNRFDDTRVIFDDESHDGSGPFNVCLVFDEVSPAPHYEKKFTDHKEAWLYFLSLMKGEFEAVEGEV